MADERNSITNTKHNVAETIADIFDKTSRHKHWARITLKDGRIFECFAVQYTSLPTEEDLDEDYDLDGLSCEDRNGKWFSFAGIDIESYEILEPR